MASENAAMRHEHILESMDNGVIALDFEGKIITFNRAAAKILGVPAENALGRYYPEVFFELEGNDEFNDVLPAAAIYVGANASSGTLSYDGTTLH